MPKHLVFDCDGTLISSQESIYLGLMTVIGTYLGREVTRDEVMQNFDPQIDFMFDRFGIPLEMKPKLLEEWGKIVSSKAYSYALFPGIKELLYTLSHEGHQLYVWTARDGYSTHKILGDLGILRFFEGIRTVTDAPVKPNPQALKELLVGVDKESCAMIGDSYTDMLGAKNFGIIGIGVTWEPTSRPEVLKEFGAKALVANTKDCYDAIAKYVKG